MASTLPPHLRTPMPKPSLLGRTVPLHRPSLGFPHRRTRSTIHSTPHAKFNLSELLGGRGLCNGEKGVEKELNRAVDEDPPPSPSDVDQPVEVTPAPVESISEDGFEKELMGLTGGFPGGEKGLQLFIEKNPPPEKPTKMTSAAALPPSSKKPKPPELPLLMPGMIALVKNPNNPYYMYCGIVQRITDGKAGVLFEGGNWDRLITFRLDELERREKGPPMKNPRSVIIEALVQKKES